VKWHGFSKDPFGFVKPPQGMQPSTAQEAVFSRLVPAVLEAFGFPQYGGVVTVAIGGHDRIHCMGRAQGTSHS
jgi:hypothetical protein